MGNVVDVTRDFSIGGALKVGHRRPRGWTKELSLNFRRRNLKPTLTEILVQTGDFVAEVPHG
jgi:hypothetical protein